ncbi:hypothetical protein [Nonomuraea sp. NPDC023979]|uniref:hypothetical protein n=1 Tax=Nonomuraea sp. NPDC023979 TaxID=3154796 RepID=UPI0033DB33AF
MPELIPLAVGVLLLAAVQAVGVTLMLLLNRREGEQALVWWYGLTGWIIWLPLYGVAALHERLAQRRRPIRRRTENKPHQEGKHHG